MKIKITRTIKVRDDGTPEVDKFGEPITWFRDAIGVGFKVVEFEGEIPDPPFKLEEEAYVWFDRETNMLRRQPNTTPVLYDMPAAMRETTRSIKVKVTLEEIR